MENITNTVTAWTPSFGMSAYGRPCAHVRTLGVDAAAIQRGDLTVSRVKGDFPGSPVWRPPTS
jgi:hypothetical protein